MPDIAIKATIVKISVEEQQRREKAIRIGTASAALEGHVVTPENKKLDELFIKGLITEDEYLALTP